MTKFIDVHVHPPVAELLEGPLAPYLGGLTDHPTFPGKPMEPDQIADLYRNRDARAVLAGWDSESATNRRPYSSADISRLVALAPDVFIGFGAVDAAKGAAAVGQVHEAHRLGLPGIAVHPAAQGRGPGDRTTFPIWEAAAGHGLVCLFHTGATELGAGMPGGGGVRLGPGNPLFVDEVAARLPELQIVIAHGGMLWRDEAIAMAVHKPNVYLCVGGQGPFRFDDELVEVIRGPLADRVVFGSGFPFAAPDAGIGQLSGLGFSAESTRRLLHDNAAALLRSELG